MRSLETGLTGLDEIVADQCDRRALERVRRELRDAGPQRLRYLADALRLGLGEGEVQRLSRIDPWFIAQIADLVLEERELGALGPDRPRFPPASPPSSARASRMHESPRCSERKRARCGARPEATRAAPRVQADRLVRGGVPGRYRLHVLDVRGGVRGGGDRRAQDRRARRRAEPDRAGHRVRLLLCTSRARDARGGVREHHGQLQPGGPFRPTTTRRTASISEPLTLEDVLEIVRVEQPDGVIVQYGGQTPLKLARALEAEGVRIVGTSPDSIDLAEDRERFRQLIEAFGLRQPPNRIARTPAGAVEHAAAIGYPIVVRPSYVLGGRAMRIVYDEAELLRYVRQAAEESRESPVLLDRFLDDAIEVDVDCASDGEAVFIGGIMEHIEQAGIHSGDSACTLPPDRALGGRAGATRRTDASACRSARSRGDLMNVQYAIKDGSIYVLEVNPRASRTVPFVSKAIGVPLARVAASCMVGLELRDFGLDRERRVRHHAVKEAVFPFVKFPGVDSLLGPEMQSTGEVMGVGRTFGEAFAKALLASGDELPARGTVFVSVRDGDKRDTVEVAHDLQCLGYEIVATGGTAASARSGRCTVPDGQQGAGGTPARRRHAEERRDRHDCEYHGRQSGDCGLVHDPPGGVAVPRNRTSPTVAGARALIEAIRAPGAPEVRSMQEIHSEAGS